MAYYINAAASFGTVKSDIKELIPDAGLRRRMSRIVKSGVATAMECLVALPEGEKISAIITATGLGCLTDSEKFLRNMIEGGEQLLTPTPFIQSTFNTVGAQVALLTGNRCYNMTYTNSRRSFEDALLDAVMKVDETGGNVLLGAVDETTPTLEKIKGRMGLLRHAGPGEGFYFFVLSAKLLPGCTAVIESVSSGGIGIPAEKVSESVPADSVRRIRYDETAGGIFDTSTAKLLFDGITAITEGEKAVVLESGEDGQRTEIVLRCWPH